MGNYHQGQIKPIIDVQRRKNDEYKATIKIVSAYDTNIKSNCLNVSVEQLENILKVFDVISENEKRKKGKLIAKLLSLGSHKAYANDEDSITYNTSIGTKTDLGLYETIKRIMADDVENLQDLT